MTDGDSKTGPSPPVPGEPPGPPPPDEFAHIPTQRTRPPLIALVAVALAVFLGFRLRQDLSFALSSASPIEGGAAQSLARLPADRLPLNRVVRISGTPERESAVILDTQGSWQFTQLFRLRGTGGRIFVRRTADPLPVPLAEKDQFTGRLLPFEELSFSRSIARHFSSRISATHFFRPQDLVKALGGSPPRLTDLAGDQVTLAADDRLFVDVLRPDEIELHLPRDRYADQAQAVRAVTGAGARVVAERETPDRWVFNVAVPPASQAQVTSALGDLDRSTRLRPARDIIDVKVADLAVAPGGEALAIARPAPGQPGTIPLARVATVRTRSPVQIPANALLLIEGEQPKDAWKSLLILAFLAVFVAVNLLALRRPA